MTSDFNAAVVRLAFAREQQAAANAVVSALRATFEADHANAIFTAANAHLLVEESAGAVKRLLLDAYLTDGEQGGLKTVGAEVKLYETLTYAEPDAIAWAKGSGMCLSLDKKAFEKVAKATDLPFVTKGEEPRVSIASDLTPFIVINP